MIAWVCKLSVNSEKNQIVAKRDGCGISEEVGSTLVHVEVEEELLTGSLLRCKVAAYGRTEGVEQTR